MSTIDKEIALAAFIREIDGNNSMGACKLAEKIIEWQSREVVAEVVSGYSGDPDTRGDKKIKAINLSNCEIGDKLYVLGE